MSQDDDASPPTSKRRTRTVKENTDDPTLSSFYPRLWRAVLDYAKSLFRLHQVTDNPFPDANEAVTSICRELLDEAMMHFKNQKRQIEDGKFRLFSANGTDISLRLLARVPRQHGESGASIDIYNMTLIYMSIQGLERHPHFSQRSAQNCCRYRGERVQSVPTAFCPEPGGADHGHQSYVGSFGIQVSILARGSRRQCRSLTSQLINSC
jgi:hypothetical protein